MSQDAVRITRQFGLDAGHRLSEHDFKCQNLHGHRYEYEVEIWGRPDPELGYVLDFSNVKGPIMAAFDHTFILNADDPIYPALADAIAGEQQKDLYLMDAEPTAENIAMEAIDLIWSSMSTQERKNVNEITVRLNETPNCRVTRTVASYLDETTYEVEP